MRRVIMLQRLLSLVLFFVVFTPLAATAQTSDSPYSGKSFDSVMKEAIRLYSEGKTNPERYEEALEAVLYAQSLDPDQAIVTYNIARTYHHLGNCEKALNHYLLYQSVAFTDSDYMDVSEYIAALTKQCGMTGSLVLHCAPSHATVSFDGERPVPCDGVHTLKTGAHHYTVMATNYLSQEDDCSIEINSVSTANIQLQRTDQAKALDTTPSLWKEPMFIAGFSSAAAGTLAVITGGIMMASAHSEDRTDQYQRSNGLLYGGATILAIGTAAVGTGLGLLLYQVFKQHDADESRVKQYQEKLAFDPMIQISPDSASFGLHIVF